MLARAVRDRGRRRRAATTPPVRLGQAVDAEQRAAERAQRRLEHRRRDRRGAVRDRAQRASSRARRRPGTAASICSIVGTKTALVTRSRSSRSSTASASNSLTRIVVAPFQSPQERPADAADVEHRQRREADRVARRSAQRGDVSAAAARLRCVVRTPFGTPVVPGRVHLHDHVAGVAAAARVDRLVRREPALVVVAHLDRCAAARQRARDAAAASRERAAGDQHAARRASASDRARAPATASRQLSGTSTAPILLAANSSSTTSGAVRSRYATRAPGPHAARRAAPARAGSSARRARVGERPLAVAERDRAARARPPWRRMTSATRSVAARHGDSPRPPRLPRGTRAIASSTSGSSVGYRWPDSSRIRSARAGDALGEDLGVGDRDHAVVAPVHDERRRRDPRQPPVAVVQRRGEQLRAVGALGERVREPLRDVLLDAVGVLAPAARAVVERHRRPRRLLGAHAQPAAEEREHVVVGRARRAARPACVAPSTSERTRSGWRSASCWATIPPSEKPYTCARSTPGRVEHRDGVVGHRLGRVGVLKRARAPDAAVVERDDAQAARRAPGRCATTRRRSARGP